MHVKEREASEKEGKKPYPAATEGIPSCYFLAGLDRFSAPAVTFLFPRLGTGKLEGSTSNGTRGGGAALLHMTRSYAAPFLLLPRQSVRICDLWE